MTSPLHSITSPVFQPIESQDSARARLNVVLVSNNAAANQRTARIFILAFGIITTIGLLFVAPLASLAAFALTCGGAYFTNSFAKYFDNLKTLFQDRSNFILGPSQTIQQLLNSLFYERATEGLPPFVKPLVENPTTSKWIVG